MAKKSFFERLTGATQEEIFEEKPKKETTPLKKTELEEFEEISSKTKTKKPRRLIEEPEVRPSAKEEWPPEEEGQLTIDVYQTDSHIIIKSTIAGVKSEDLDISMTNDMITVKGMRQKDESIPQENYYNQELYWGPFSRSIILPADIDSSKIKASLKDGILTIKLPKAEQLKTKTIKVREAE